MLRSISRRKWFAAIVGAAALLLSTAPVQAGNIEVQVGYADNIRPSPFFPVPWQGGSGVALFAGGGSSFDAGAIRVINNTGADIVIQALHVDGFGDGTNYKIWDAYFPYTLKDGMSAIFTQTFSYNFDSSDNQGGGPASAIPVVHLKIDGVTKDLSDTAQVLNTEGTDHLAAAGENESHQWRDIGTYGGQAAAPEPATMTMLGIGVLGLGGYAWRRKKLLRKVA